MTRPPPNDEREGVRRGDGRCVFLFFKSVGREEELGLGDSWVSFIGHGMYIVLGILLGL